MPILTIDIPQQTFESLAMELSALAGTMNVWGVRRKACGGSGAPTATRTSTPTWGGVRHGATVV